MALAQGTRNASHPIEMLAVPGRGRRARSVLKIFGRLLPSVFEGSGKESKSTSDSATLRSERLVIACHAISSALSPDHHSAGLDRFRCNLCGSRCSPRGHVCPRLYGR